MNPRSINRRQLLALMGAAGALTHGHRALAQTATPAAAADAGGRFVFGIPPGAAGTTLAKALIADLATRYAPAYKLEHVLGRDGRRSVTTVKAAKPDGQNLLFAQSALITLFPSIYRDLGYSPRQDLIPIAAISDFSFMFVVGPRVPAEVRTLNDYLVWVSENPAWRQVGVILKGSQGWLMTQQLVRERNAPLQAVAYAGGAPVAADLLGGGLAAGFIVTGNAAAERADGRLRALAVGSTKRWLGMPDTPTFTELGLNGMAMPAWYGLFAPAGMDGELVQRLRAAVNSSLESPNLAKALEQLSMPTALASPDAVLRRIDQETQFYADAVQQARLDTI